MARKLKKIILIVVSVLAVMIIALALTISPLAKNYIQKHSKELIGRKVVMKNLHLNIFTGRLEVDSLRMYEVNDRDLFAAVDTFLVRVSLLKLISSKVQVNELRVVAPYSEILQNGSHFNYDDLIPKEDTTKAPKSKSSFPKSIVINNINVSRGKLIYTDLQLKNTIRMNDLGVTIPRLTFDQGNTNAGIHLIIGDKAKLNSLLTMNMKTNEYKLTLDLTSLPAGIITPYIKAYYNIGKLEGLVNTKLLFTGNLNHIMDFKISGSGNVTDFNVTNMLGEPVANAKFASVKINDIYLPTSTYLFDNVYATNANLSFILTPGTDNLSVLLKPEDKKNTVSAAESAPMTVRIKDLHLTKSQLNYTDKTLRTPCILPIKNIDFAAKNFDMNGTNEFNAKASFPNGGNMIFSWKGNMNDLSNQHILVNLQNLNLRLLSPYCLNYTAFDIKNGNLNFISKNNIRNNNIESVNILDVYKMNVGNKHKDLKTEYNVPLRLALYILKDKDDKIKFDVPVKGSIKDPKFSYRKIIFKTLVNLMVKVAVSPVRFLANSLGMKSDNMDVIPIEPLKSGFTAEQYSQLNDLATIIKSKPDMTLTLTQFVNLKEAIPLYTLYKAKESYLESLNQSEIKDPINYEELQSLKNNDANFMAYVDTLLMKQGKAFSNVPLPEKVNSLYSPDSIRAEFQKKMENRNQMIQNYLITNAEVPAKNILITTADNPTLETYAEKARYKIDMTLPGTEKPVE